MIDLLTLILSIVVLLPLGIAVIGVPLLIFRFIYEGIRDREFEIIIVGAVLMFVYGFVGLMLLNIFTR